MLLSKLAYQIKGAIAPFFYAGKFSGWDVVGCCSKLHKSKKLFTIIILVRKRTQKNLLSYTQTQKFKIFLKRKRLGLA